MEMRGAVESRIIAMRKTNTEILSFAQNDDLGGRMNVRLWMA